MHTWPSLKWENTDNFCLITQNIDGLHAKVGSKNIIELHGNIWRMKCVAKGKSVENFEVPLSEIPPKCSCRSIYRPDVVWFGEQLSPSNLEKAFNASGRCSLMMVIGTSGVVQPAASLPFMAKRNHAYLIEVNVEATPVSPIADLSLRGKVGEILPRIYAHLQ